MVNPLSRDKAVQELIEIINTYDFSIEQYDELKYCIEIMQLDTDEGVIKEFKFYKKMLVDYKTKLNKLAEELKRRKLTEDA